MTLTHGVIVWDLDGTLIQTSSLYTEATDRYADWLAATCGATTVEVKDVFTSHDAQKAREHGFSRHRFPQSMAEMADYFWQENGIDGTPDMRRKARSFGYGVFKHKAREFPETHDVLRTLGEHFSQYLLTMGDDEVQHKRITDARLWPYFTDVRIVPRKTPEVLADLIGPLGGYFRSQIWAIGDSLRSDILPAVKCGVNAVLISGPTWGYEQADIPEALYTRVASLADAAVHVLNHGVPSARDRGVVGAA